MLLHSQLTIQLHHGEVTIPEQFTTYYFSINPSEKIPLDPNQTGTYSSTTISRIISASISTTVNGTLGSTETSTYILYVGGNSKSFTNTLSHDVDFSSFIEEVDLPASTTNKIYMRWRTPASWTTPATNVSHNVVLYCTRDYNPA